MIPVRPHRQYARSILHAGGTASRTFPVSALRPLLATVLLFGALGVLAQPPAQESLTEDFPGLSAKERSRIAKKEVEAAAADTAFQALMKASEALFQERRYEEALEGFRKARAARPYNVYPKVKIHDLEAMLSKKAGGAVTTPTDLPAPDPVAPTSPPLNETPAPFQDGPSADPPPAVTAPVPAPAVARPKVDPPVPRPLPDPVPVPSSSPAVAPPPTIEGTPTKDGMVERSFKEGNAYVIERSVTEDGRTTVFKRVIHPWGGTYHFRDGKAIDERVWKEQFGGN